MLQNIIELDLIQIQKKLKWRNVKNVAVDDS